MSSEEVVRDDEETQHLTPEDQSDAMKTGSDEPETARNEMMDDGMDEEESALKEEEKNKERAVVEKEQVVQAEIFL
eukprot:m.203236 g.203236  ORF g.203236 m.203236 type:complete len:76 (+) comp13728_c3_seq1:91-318(+)